MTVTSANGAHLKHLVLFQVFQLIQREEMPLHHGVSVGQGVREEDLVITVLKFVLKAQTVVGLPKCIRLVILSVLTVWSLDNLFLHEYLIDCMNSFTLLKSIQFQISLKI